MRSVYITARAKRLVSIQCSAIEAEGRSPVERTSPCVVGRSVWAYSRATSFCIRGGDNFSGWCKLQHHSMGSWVSY